MSNTHQQSPLNLTLVSSENGFDDYNVEGLPGVHRVCIGRGIGTGDLFNVYCDGGRKLGGVWQGALEKSLGHFAVSHAPYRTLLDELRAERLNAAQTVLNAYYLGADLTNPTHRAWDSSDLRDLQCFVDARHQSADDVQTVKLDFHVKFDGSGSVIEAYAHDMSRRIVGWRGDIMDRYPGSEMLVQTVSEAYETIENARDALTTISALAGFRFGYVDEKTRCTVSFHIDTHRGAGWPADMVRVFSFVGEVE